MQKGKQIFVCGLPKSGKTTWIIQSILYFRSLQQDIRVFKPFDIGEQKKRKLEEVSDREIFSKYSALHPAILNPYHFSQELPLFFASNFDGFLINLLRVDQCFQKIITSNSTTLIEILGGITQPLTNELNLLEWLKKKTNKIFWIMDCTEKKFLWNFAEIKILQNFFQIYVILNNYKKSFNASWLQQLWILMDKQENCTVIGCIPPIKDSNHCHQEIKKIYQKDLQF